MIRFIARFAARLQYIWKLEIEGHTNDVNAELAVKRAKEKRAYVEQLNREADEIAENISREEQTDAYKALSGQEKYEADREKADAQKIVAEKRRVAAEEETKASEGEQTAEYFRGMAKNSRIVADKIRAL
jgi:hypothetical protein